jgi:hypothetical protein
LFRKLEPHQRLAAWVFGSLWTIALVFIVAQNLV